MEAAGSPKSAAFLKTFFTHAGNTIPALRKILDENPADLPSRSRSGADCILSNSAWDQVKRLFGPHTFDLMSLASKCQHNRVGLHLPHFKPCPTPESSSINVFAHSLPMDHSSFVFPPFTFIAPLLRYLLE